MSLRKYFTNMAEVSNIPEGKVVTVPGVSAAPHYADVTANKQSNTGGHIKPNFFGNSNLSVANASRGVKSFVSVVGSQTRGRTVYGFSDSPNQDYLASRRLSHNRITAIGSSTVAIDNKIEQAMDLVKSHLMFAVREEVEVLKEQIAELIERNNQLEYENGILRAAASPETLAKLAQPRQQPPSSSSS